MGMRWLPNGITERQWDVWKLVADGLTNHEIATELNWGSTVIGYELFQLYKKLRVSEGSKRVKLVLMFPRQAE